MKILILFFALISQLAFAGLPPTTSKDSADSTNITTFNYQFPNFTGTHSGATFTLGALTDGSTIVNGADNTKILAFSLGGMTTGKTLTLSSSQSASETLTIPNITGADTIATLGLSQTFTAATTFSSNVTVTGTGRVSVQPTTATNTAFNTWLNNGGTAYMGLDSSTGGSFGAGNYTLGIQSPTKIAFLTNAGTLALSLDTSQNANFSGQMFLPNMTNNGTGITAGEVCWVTSTGKLVYDTSGTCFASSERYKHSIKSLPDVGLKQVMALHPVTYFKNVEKGSNLEKDKNFTHEKVGFIAEEVVKVNPDFVPLDDGGKPATVVYQEMVPLLVKAIQEQQNTIQKQQLSLATEQIEIQTLTAQVKRLSSK